MVKLKMALALAIGLAFTAMIVYGQQPRNPTWNPLKVYQTCPADGSVPHYKDQIGCYDLDLTMGEVQINLDQVTQIRVTFGQQTISLTPNDIMLKLNQ